METLIIYATKYGCTADCAAYLQGKLAGNVTLADVNKGTTPDLAEFDRVIIGGSVYISKVNKKLRAFCESNAQTLAGKEVSIFLCCALVDEVKKVLAMNFPVALVEGATAIGFFGSEARLEKMGFLDRTLIKAVTKGDFSKFVISKERMDEFVAEIIRQM